MGAVRFIFSRLSHCRRRPERFWKIGLESENGLENEYFIFPFDSIRMGGGGVYGADIYYVA